MSVPTASAEPPPANPPENPSQSRFGVVEAYEAGNLAQAAGARWDRLFFWWNQIQPNGSQEWRTDKIISDQQVDAALERGMSLVGLLGNPPAWATRNGSVPSNLSLAPTDPNNTWASFVSAIVKRYAGRIDYWIIWNEPDIDIGEPWNTWGGSEEEYYQLIKTAYIAAKAANPAARIIFAGTTYWNDVLSSRKQFLERVLERAVLDPTSKANNYYFDAVDIHVYSRSMDMYSIPLAYRDVLRRYGTDKPLWISESNVVPWNDPISPMPSGGYRATQEEQASFTIQGMALAMAAGIERVGVYKMIDGKITNGEAYGLVRNDGSTRPAYAAFQTASRYFSGFPNADFDTVDDMTRVTMQSGDRKVTVLWNPTPKGKTVRIRALGAQATLVDKHGKAAPAKIPTIPGQNYYSFDLAPATANVADFSPDSYIIGGDPVILVEEGIGQGVAVSPSEVFYPTAGYSVGGGFLSFFQKWGGLAVFGYPRSGEIRENNQTVQYFQRARLEYFPEHAGTPYEVQMGLLNMDLTRSKTFAAAEPFEGTVDRFYFPETGHSIQGPFLRFFLDHGGIDILGYPWSEEMVEGTLRVQHFQRMRLELHQTATGQATVEIGNMGDEYIQAHNLLK